MRRARRLLGFVTVVWLSLQLGSFAFGPIALAMGMADESIPECTCAHDGQAACPMHHGQAPGSKVCRLRGTGENAIVALGSLFGTQGLPPASRYEDVAVVTPGPVQVDVTWTIARSSPPDPPPPRA